MLLQDNADAKKTGTEEDDRNLADLLVDQIEFSGTLGLHDISAWSLGPLLTCLNCTDLSATLLEIRQQPLCVFCRRDHLEQD